MYVRAYVSQHRNLIEVTTAKWEKNERATGTEIAETRLWRSASNTHSTRKKNKKIKSH